MNEEPQQQPEKDTPEAHWARFEQAVKKAVTMPKEELAARLAEEKKRKQPDSAA